jgi:hypothetical protein
MADALAQVVAGRVLTLDLWVMSNPTPFHEVPLRPAISLLSSSDSP